MIDKTKMSEVEIKPVDDFYTQDSREKMVEDDSLDPSEAAFMKGYEEAME